MNRKKLETRWKRHHEKQEWQKEAEKEIETEESSQPIRRKLSSRTTGLSQGVVCGK